MKPQLPRKTVHIDLDSLDSILPLYDGFYYPRDESGEKKCYLCGHSLGLQPKAARKEMDQQMQHWRNLAVEGHMKGDSPWLTYTESMVPSMARLIGAKENEVVIMNSLTVNLHLMLSSFYQPRGNRRKILMEAPAFPSDRYAVRSHLQFKGSDPERDLICWSANQQSRFDLNRLEEILEMNRDYLQLLVIGGVNYLTGEVLELEKITDLAHQFDVMVGFDLAHAIGNIPMELHEWDVDFAVWCNYKYLNGGPGCIAAAFIHDRHYDQTWPRLEGWWGNALQNRFEMLDVFTPANGAAAWALSTPTSLALAPLKASLENFDDITMPVLRRKSMLLMEYLEDQLLQLDVPSMQIITPSAPEHRGAMLSLQFQDNAEQVFKLMTEQNFVVDFRRPGMIRVSANPLYNSFADLNSFTSSLQRVLKKK